VQTRTEQVGDELVLSLEGEIGIADAVRLREELVGAFDRAGQVTVDLAGAQDMDTAAIQLLCSAEHTARKRKKTFSLRRISEGVMHSVGLLGLGEGALFASGGEEVRS
jgi:anti-anti-sigma factor